ncbi:MAG: peptidase M12 [Hyphomicrobiaceae bacterium]|nr:MAG: peptidase M12 [Hyphomicrobiaceae bacterium]
MNDISCTIKQLPGELHAEAAHTAICCNPVNRPPSLVEPQHIAVMTTKYWGAGGVNLGVAFMDRISMSFANKILSHMNAWGKLANVKFFMTGDNPQVRIGFERGGYWSYLGTDILHIPKNKQTMNLEGFTERTSDAEFTRVVRHETGHTLGFPHEHLRRDLVARLDPAKTIAYFSRTQGWTPDQVRAQVLTPIEEASLLSPTPVDAESIMCYQLPSSITVDGRPIVGGADIDETDHQYAARIYPKADQPAPPVSGNEVWVITGQNVKIERKS